MHRILWALSAIFVAAGAAGPWYMGNVAEEQFNQSLAQMPKDNPYLEVTEVKFERGYQNSQAQVTLRYSLPEAEIQPFSLVFQSNIQHSPLTYTDQGLLFLGIYSDDKVTLDGLSADAQAAYEKYLGGQILTGHTRVNLSGEYQSSLSRQLVSISNEVEGFELEVGALSLDLHGDLAANSLNMLLDMQPSKFISADAEVHVAGVKTTSALTRHNEKTFLGDTQLSVSNIKVFTAGMPIDLNNFVISASNALVNEKLNTTVTYSVETIEAPLPVSSASYSFELNGMSLDALEQLENMGMQPATGNQAAAFSTEQYAEQLSQLLQPGLQLNQELKVGAFGGDLLVDLDVEYKGLKGEFTLQDLENPAQAIAAIQASMLVKATAESVMQTPAAPMVDGFVQQGFIKQEGEELLSQVLLEDGKLSVNGTDIPLEPIIKGLIDKYTQQQLEQMEQEEQMEQAEQQSSL